MRHPHRKEDMIMKWPEKKEMVGNKIELSFESGWNACLKECKKSYEKESNVSPHKLYEMAGGNTEKYIELMKAHGYIIPKKQQPKLFPLDEKRQRGECCSRYPSCIHSYWASVRITNNNQQPTPSPALTAQDIQNIINSFTGSKGQKLYSDSLAQAIFDRIK